MPTNQDISMQLSLLLDSSHETSEKMDGLREDVAAVDKRVVAVETTLVSLARVQDRLDAHDLKLDGLGNRVTTLETESHEAQLKPRVHWTSYVTVAASAIMLLAAFIIWVVK